MFRWQLIGPVASWDCWPYPEAVRLHQVHPSPEGHQAQVDLACYNQCLLEQSWRTREMIEKGQKNQKNINPSIWSLSQREIFFLINVNLTYIDIVHIVHIVLNCMGIENLFLKPRYEAGGAGLNSQRGERHNRWVKRCKKRKKQNVCVAIVCRVCPKLATISWAHHPSISGPMPASLTTTSVRFVSHDVLA